jgi:hypothetical protein
MAVLAVWALLLTTPAPVPAAAPVSVQVVSVKAISPSAASGVVVKLGNASLEEYTQGDPAHRVQLMRSN